MDRNREGGQGWMVRKWRALTLLVEWKVLALTHRWPRLAQPAAGASAPIRRQTPGGWARSSATLYAATALRSSGECHRRPRGLFSEPIRGGPR